MADKKDFKHFGVMLDCSNNAVTTPQKLREFIDLIAEMGYNCLEIYTEDTYEVAGEPYFGYLRGRYSIAEMKSLDAYALSRGIELIPCIETLAHLSCLVKNEVYAPINDTADILLVGDERTYELIDRMLSTLAECFTSREINIGMDEAHMVGLGKYLDRNGYRNRYEIITEHLTRVKNIAEKYGFHAHMWGDMFFRLGQNGIYRQHGAHVPKEVRDRFPENVGIAMWDYYNREQTIYDDMLKAHEEFDREIWFAGGAWSWSGFSPFNRYSLTTMLPAMRAVREHKVDHVLMTIWGDYGAECSPFATLPALYAIRRFADGMEDMTVIRREFEEKFGMAFDDFMLLDLPNDPTVPTADVGQYAAIEMPAKAYLYNDPFLGLADPIVKKKPPVPYADVAAKLTEAATRVKNFTYLFDTGAALSSLMELKTTLGIRSRKAYQAHDAAALRTLADDYAECVRRLDVFRNAFHAQWMTDNKPFGWEIQEIRLGGVRARLLDCGERIAKAAADPTYEIPELAETLLPYHENPIDDFFRKLVSPGVL